MRASSACSASAACAPERPDERAVVDVVDLAGAVVELDLLQRRERAVASLEQRQQLLGLAARVDQLGLGRLAQERQRDDHDRGDRDQRAEDQRRHARASESRVTSRRCSRASGHIATSDPKTKR